MTAERFRQVRNVFDLALEREPAARTAFIEEAPIACDVRYPSGIVLRLLARGT
jgi:hypothetical protein